MCASMYLLLHPLVVKVIVVFSFIGGISIFSNLELEKRTKIGCKIWKQSKKGTSSLTG